MGRAACIDGTAHLGEPDLDPVNTEHDRQTDELIDIERPLVLADHNRVPRAVRGPQLRQQRGRLRPLTPRQPPRTTDVEELPRDDPVTCDHRLGDLPLPRTRREPVLVVRRRGSPVEREPQSSITTILLTAPAVGAP